MARIGFIGTGVMGGHMARRLAEAGHVVRAWNRSPEKAERLAVHGVGPVATARETAADADIVIAMLSDGPTSERVLFSDGVAEAMPRGAILVDMASIPVATAREEARRAGDLGLGFLDAPVSGGEGGARDGTLAIMAGGAADHFASLAPVFGAMGRPTHVGPAGTGALAKLCNQLIVGNTLATVAEALLLAEAGGADPAAVRTALMGGFADSSILKVHGERMLKGDFTPGGASKYQLKDLRTAVSHARSLNLSMPVTEIVTSLFGEHVEHGGGDTDQSAIILELRRVNGID